MAPKFLRTSDLARAVGIHPNTVRLYVDRGLLPPVERSLSGYRLFTQRHLNCLRLARTIYAAEYPGRELRASGTEIIQHVAVDDLTGALEKAQEHLALVQSELERAHAAADLLEHWAQNMDANAERKPMPIGEVSKRLDISIDAIRNWERDGLIRVPRNPDNGYRRFGAREIGRLRIIRMLGRSGYSHMAMLRMFIELDAGNTRDLRKLLDAPRPDEDVFTAADHWLTTLQGQAQMSHLVILMIEELIAGRDVSP